MTSAGILKDIPPSSPALENSPVHAIDANTLSQEQTQDDIFAKIDNYPSNLIAPKPLQEVPACSSNQLIEIPEEGARFPVKVETITKPIVNENDVDEAFCPGWTPLFLVAFSLGLRLPFSLFVNDLLEHMNRAPGQIHPIGWLNITIFQVACKKARVQATVPLFASLFTSKHKPYDTSLAAKGGGRLSKNFLAGLRPNKINSNRFDGQWFFVRGGMGPMVPIWWTTLGEAGSLFVIDSAFIKSQKRSSIEASASVSKKAKIEALAVVPAPSTSPNTIRPEAIALDDELTTSPRRQLVPRRAFHAIHLLLLAEEGRKHPSNDPLDVFALSAIYMIKALNTNYACTTRELLKEMSSEKALEDLTAAQVSLKEKDEELTNCKEALSTEDVGCRKLQEENSLEAELEKLKCYQSTLTNDVEDSRAATVAATKRAEDAETRAMSDESRLSQVDEEVAWRVAAFKDNEEGDLFVGKESAAGVFGFVTKFLNDYPQLVGMYNEFKKPWPAEYFEGLSVESLLESSTEVAEEEVEVVDREGVDNDEATS
ncbi:hypothetical protein LIER_13255 [Lithospermum erythrorhizon]|uniref:Transposase (putative) gypsy type domain-containing protein n=1 Tax=Lithospermum erythrorhizon TaxID=34254 RepID=A0AAV3PZC7_LITER